MNTTPPKTEITLSELLSLVWQEKWLVVLIATLGMAASVAYALLATEWWKADTLLAPADQKGQGLSGSLGALGGLAGIAGINLESGDTAEPIATLQSQEFIGAFIMDRDLLRVLFADEWDAANKRWKGLNPKKWPDVRDGIRKFQRDILTVSEDTKTHLVAVEVEWTDPVVAASWANQLVERLNARMRDRALVEAERNVTYLRSELGHSDVVALQESLSHLLEREMQKMMLARGNPEYSFRVIDRATPPKWRARPKRIAVVLIGTAASGLLAVFIAVVRGRRRQPIPS